MFKNDETTKSYIGCLLEKCVEFGFEKEEIIIILMNASSKTDLSKILKAIDYIEPIGKDGFAEIRTDVSKEEAEKELFKILVGDL